MNMQNSIRNTWKEYENYFDVAGRRHVNSLLTQSSEPWQTIEQIQQNYGLANQQASVAVKLLDMLEVPRSTVYSTLLDSAKAALEQQLDRMDPQSLLLLLKETIQVLTIQELKSIPVGIIKRLPVVPEQYLQLLAKHGFVGEFPVAVKQQIWRLNSAAFEGELEPLCTQLLVGGGTKETLSFAVRFSNSLI